MRIIRQGEGFVSAEIGDLTVTALYDGHVDLPGDSLRRADGRIVDIGPLLINGKIRLPVFAFLVHGPYGAVLIDAGAGSAWESSLGGAFAAMGRAGIDPKVVSEIALTHSHYDHMGGLIGPSAAQQFPNLHRIWVPIDEMGLFRERMTGSTLTEKIRPLQQGDGPMRGVTALAAPGHTPGHTAYLVEGRLLIWGDLVHVPLIQIPLPYLAWIDDQDKPRARETRQHLMQMAVKEGWMVAGSHLAMPPFGHLKTEGAGYVFDALGDA